MSTFAVTVEQLTIHPHPNADALELAQVGLYRAVVRKGQFQTGDWAVYIPEQAVLPPELIEELGLVGRLAGPGKDRVKAVRLRGEVSQGIVCRPDAVPIDWAEFRAQVDAHDAPPPNDWAGEFELKVNWAGKLGIKKWVPPIPVGMAGEVEAASGLIPWSDIENIQRLPNIFTDGEEVVATEKAHGSCFQLTYLVFEDRVQVTSKGLGAKSLALKASDTNLYWRAARRYGLPGLAKYLADSLGAKRVALFGEVYGKGVQDLHYGKDASSDETLGFVLFDIAYDRGDGSVFFLDDSVIDSIVNLRLPALQKVPRVPVLYRGPYDFKVLAELAEGKETLSGESLHVREGLVIRPAHGRPSDVLGGSRAIAKLVGQGYLLRSGDTTEYE